ncbi:glycoside hydrolase family 73 protein [Zoogloea sp. LCSB751]|uniref:glycoside hydrolase family 73 protein n=1 Tax=Zoogloea sp. LCSB751 TaxID=1965277 RepID=UPI001C1F32A3|nr:glucosaminidase domain-containing protein [Zoogloea sp. LCSB751]
MLRPDAAFQAGAAGLSGFADDIALPTGGAGQGDFAALMRDVNREVTDFIENGGGDSAAVAGLNAAARAYLARQGMATAAEPASAAVQEEGLPADSRAFLSAIAPLAAETGRRLGVSPDILAAQAALESGWGQRPIRQSDGRDSHNLFGIKAGGAWQGDSASVVTIEYEGGAKLTRTERFRSYANPGEAFRDFGRLLLDNPRYKGALNAGGDVAAYARGLAQGGYATDPQYGAKLARIASRLQSGE